MRVYLCISESKDLDLYELYLNIGANNLRKITKLCVMGIFDEKAASKARQIALSNENRGGSWEKYLGGIKLRINVAEKESGLQYMLSSIKPGLCSNFLKTCIRQILGPQVILKYFMKNPDEISSSTITFAPSTVSFAVYQPLTTPVRRNAKYPLTVAEVDESNINFAQRPSSIESNIENNTTQIPMQRDVPTASPAINTPIQQVPDNNDEDGDDFDMLSALEAML